MKNHLSRRQFIKKSALVGGAGISLPLITSSAQETNAPAAVATAVLPPAPAPIAAPPGFGVAPGPFQPTWESLSAGYQAPDWFRDAKFGMFIRWGPCTVGDREIGWGRHANRPWDINQHGLRNSDPDYDGFYLH